MFDSIISGSNFVKEEIISISNSLKSYFAKGDNILRLCGWESSLSFR